MSGMGCWGCLLGVAIALGNTFNAHCALAQITPDGTLPNNSIVTPSGNIINITGGTQAGGNLFHSFKDFSVPTGSGAFFNNALSIQNIISRVTGGSVSNIDGLIRTLGTANLFLINPNGIIFGPNASLNVGGSFVASTANAIQFGDIGFFSADNPNAPTPLLTINPSALLFNQLPTAITNRSQAPAGTNPAGVEVTGLRVPDGKSLLLGGGNISVDGGALRAYGGRIELTGLASPGVVGLNVAENTLSFSVPNEIPRADISLTNAAEINVRGADGGNIAINAQNLSLAGESKLRAGIDTGLGTPQSKAGDIDINATGVTTLTDGSFIANVPQETSVGKGGNVNITTGSLGLINGSYLNNNNYGQGDGGNINLNVRDALTLAGVDQSGFASAIESRVRSQAVGNGGNINIQAGSVSLADGASLNASTSGKGDAGSVFVQAKDSVSIGSSYIFSGTAKGSVGNGGNINVTAGSLSLTDNAVLSTSTSGTGDAGTVLLQAKDFVSVANSGVLSYVIRGAVGNAGNINVTTGSLSVTDGAQLDATTFGTGDAGSVIIDASRVSLDGNKTIVFSIVENTGRGKSGDIRITTDSLSLTNGAQLLAGTYGQGDAGSINIKARDTVSFDGGSRVFSLVDAGAVGKGGSVNITTGSLLVNNGSQLSASSFGEGNAGSVTINARDTVRFNGAASAAFSIAGSGAVGEGGDINITTGSLSVTNGAFLTTSTLGRGDAGNVTINARDTVAFDGVGSDGRNSAALSRVLPEAVGKGGDINITTGSLSVTNGAFLTASTLGRGDAGNVKINARDTVSLDGKGSILSSVGTGAEGNGGNININAASLSLKDGAQLVTSTLGKGDAGSVVVRASDSVSLAGSNTGILSSVESGAQGNGANININAASLSLTKGAQLLTSVDGIPGNQPFRRGNAGNVNVDVTGAVTIAGAQDGISSGIRSTLGTGIIGKGGNISTSSGSLSLSDGARVSASTFGSGDAGNVFVQAKNFVSLADATIFSSVENGGGGNGGDINVTTGSLSLTNGAQLVATSRGRNINITGVSPIDFVQLLARVFGGNAGNLQINATDAVSISGANSITGDSSGLFTDTNSIGKGGNITVNTSALRVSDGAVLDARTNNFGNGGNITVNAQLVEAINGGQLITTTSGSGSAGKITVNATDRVIVNGTDATFNDRVAKFGKAANPEAASGFFVRSKSSGSAGDIEVTSPQIRLDNTGTINAESASGNGGNINLLVRDLLLLRRGSQISATAGTALAGGDGGNITINARNGFIVAVPNENSDITANAFTGAGGKVDIRTQGIYGIESRPRQTFLSDITASSERGISGEVTINRPDVDESLGLVELPTVLTGTSELIAETTCAGVASTDSDTEKSRFTFTGRGGLPPNPYEPLSIDVVWLDTRLSTITSRQQRSEKPAAKPPSKAETVKILPATGWVFDGKGNVTLISHTSGRTSLGATPAGCPKQ